MLISVGVANVLSFRDEQRLSFVATELNERKPLADQPGNGQGPAGELRAGTSPA
ncbi:MAG: hypothetical protein ACRDSL_11145 [Pseudonocardiaceae bacterium]